MQNSIRNKLRIEFCIQAVVLKVDSASMLAQKWAGVRSDTALPWQLNYFLWLIEGKLWKPISPFSFHPPKKLVRLLTDMF